MKRKTAIGLVLTLVFVSSIFATSAIGTNEVASFPTWKHYTVDGANYGNEDIRDDVTFTFWKLYHVEDEIPSDWEVNDA